MVRLQVKQEQHQALLSVQKGDSQVSHIAKELPHLPETTVKMSFIKQREDSWQLHLQQISPFLIAGEGVWWTRRPNGFHFHDGDQDSSTKDDGLDLLHHRHHSIQDAEERRRKCWKKIIDDTIIIPANSIEVYNTHGNPIGKMVYSDKGVIQKNLLTSTVGIKPHRLLIAHHYSNLAIQTAPLRSNLTTPCFYYLVIQTAPLCS